LFPLWYQTVCLEVSLPTPLTVAPDIVVQV